MRKRQDGELNRLLSALKPPTLEEAFEKRIKEKFVHLHEFVDDDLDQDTDSEGRPDDPDD